MTHHVVIVGGGTGGTVLANDLADRLASEMGSGGVKLTLVNDDADHVYKPVWLYVPFGQRESADGRRPLADLVDDSVEIRIDRVTDIDTDARRLRTREGARVEYDSLVLATGSRLAPEEMARDLAGTTATLAESADEIATGETVGLAEAVGQNGAELEDALESLVVLQQTGTLEELVELAEVVSLLTAALDDEMVRSLAGTGSSLGELAQTAADSDTRDGLGTVL